MILFRFAVVLLVWVIFSSMCILATACTAASETTPQTQAAATDGDGVQTVELELRPVDVDMEAKRLEVETKSADAAIVAEADSPEPGLADKKQFKAQWVDVTPHVEKTDHKLMTTYRFLGPIRSTKNYRIACNASHLAVGGSIGLLLYDRKQETWRLYDEQHGLPGKRVHQVGFLSPNELAIEIWKEEEYELGQYSVVSVGVYRLNIKTGIIETIPNVKRDVRQFDGQYIIAGSAGVLILQHATGHSQLLDGTNSNLLHPTTSAIHRHGDRLWIASRGQFVGENTFKGGGVTSMHLVTGRGRQYGESSGLSNPYVTDLVVNDDTVWAAHWHNQRGLSMLDRTTDQWTPVYKSMNNIELGGIRLLLDEDLLWIGRQDGLVIFNTRTLYAHHVKQRDGLPGYIITDFVKEGDHIWVSAMKYVRPPVNEMSGIAVFHRRTIGLSTP